MKSNLKRSKSIAGTILEGSGAGWPICLGYMPIGLAFGVVAQQAGLSPLQTGLMSVIVYAGSSQFIAVSMIAGGAGSLAIILTTLVVNLRHMLMSSSLAVFLTGRKPGELCLYAYGVTDESFAMNHARFSRGGWDAEHALVVNHVTNLTWILCSILGAYTGQFIPAEALGLDYALRAMFIGLLIFQLRSPVHIATALTAGGLALLFARIAPGNAYILLGSLLGATIVFLIKRLNHRAGGGGA